MNSGCRLSYTTCLSIALRVNISNVHLCVRVLLEVLGDILDRLANSKTSVQIAIDVTYSLVRRGLLVLLLLLKRFADRSETIKQLRLEDQRDVRLVELLYMA